MVAPEYFGGTKANVHVPVGTEKLKTDLKVTYDGGSLSFSTGYFNEMEVIWVHPSVNPSDVNLGATHTATYQVTLDGVETVVATKEVLAGEVPGPVDLSEWLLYTEITAFDAGYQEALWSDQTFNYTLEPLQLFMAYIYWKSDTWHYERYALEAGDTLILPEGYATSSGMRFERWSMEGFTWNFEGSDLGTRVLTPEDLGYYKQLGFTHIGFDSGMQVENFSGTYSECVAEYVTDVSTIASKPGVSVIGQYDQERIEITFMYPALTYYMYGNEYVIFARQLEDTYWYGTKPIASMPSYPYWIPIGWDADGDNVADYGYDNSPLATELAVYRLKLIQDGVHTVTYRTDYGTFSNGEQEITFEGTYEACRTFINDFEEILLPVIENGFKYTFENWTEKIGPYTFEYDAVWSSEFPNTFTEDVTIAATYNRIDYAYEITFDAGGGYFNEDPSQIQIVLEYTYGDSVVVPSNPEKPDSGLYGYDFIGWTPEVGSVTGNETYRAQYRTYLLEGEAVGITVSNGSVTEDISVGSLSEYVFDVSGDVPELQITTGSIVTISGVSSAIRIRIDETVTDVVFSDLTLTFNGALNYEALIIDGASRPLDILIEGNCVLENQVTDGVTVYADRETHFIGRGTAPNLSLEGRAYTLIYHSESLYFETMTLDGITHNGTTETGLSFSDGSEGIKFVLTNVAGTFASENTGFSGSELEFIDSSLSVQCAGGLGFVSALSVANSALSMTGLSGLTAETLVTVTEGGPISILSDSGPALRAADGISIADVYDLGSLTIAQVSEGGAVYFTLATYDGSEWIPASSIILQME
ncbi:InlB B-repeat-containing protein [Fusibacter tunisiensis]|uniref:Bacterial repeat domain-containing protein n=1 Tax=Fusibacter tunisiensis TaxID=1008308 RepID=A0ABS2MU85_9FIRM|nr:InlB B-repeat-containing protein [Fusibacter tunisiensis]MBM7562973.1 hypothetical protein [Fusibacter tunisiensis]